MKFLKNNIIGQIKSISLVQLARSDGVHLKRVGTNWIGVCPFHLEKTGSLVVTPSKNLFHCFGCGAGGSPIDYVMLLKGLGFRQAVEWLASSFSITLDYEKAEENYRKEITSVDRIDMEKVLDKSDVQLLGQAIELYHQTLKTSNAALGYLETRGLNSMEMIDKYKLGYSNRTLLQTLPTQRNQSTNVELIIVCLFGSFCWLILTFAVSRKRHKLKYLKR